MNKNEAKEMLSSIKQIKGVLSELNGEENKLINKLGSPNYFLNEVISENRIQSKKIVLRKYILKNDEKYGFIKPTELEKGKFLYEEMVKLINDFLGKDYVLISLQDTDNRTRHSEDSEHFSLIFKKVFTNKMSGNIKAFRLENCEKAIALGKISVQQNKKYKIGIDQVSKNALLYEGELFKGRNVLFYGYNIEENPFLVELFEGYPPNRILNIIPIGDMRSYFDNVD
jgi:hypothetical protein